MLQVCSGVSASAERGCAYVTIVLIFHQFIYNLAGNTYTSKSLTRVIVLTRKKFGAAAIVWFTSRHIKATRGYFRALAMKAARAASTLDKIACLVSFAPTHIAPRARFHASGHLLQGCGQAPAIDF